MCGPYNVCWCTESYSTYVGLHGWCDGTIDKEHVAFICTTDTTVYIGIPLYHRLLDERPTTHVISQYASCHISALMRLLLSRVTN